MTDKVMAVVMIIGGIGLAFLMAYGMASIGDPRSLWLMKLIGAM